MELSTLLAQHFMLAWVWSIDVFLLFFFLYLSENMGAGLYAPLRIMVYENSRGGDCRWVR